ncbi:MAG: hypothetical protein CMJ78_08990 [Planctomycetaceae bacterium]|nr:hypothetical protein [Planctomycetaceae bacterium]
MNTDNSEREECELLRELRSTPALFEELASLDGVSEFKTQARLRKKHSPELVRAAMTLQELRQRATLKFHRAEQMWFDRQGLEQATSEKIAFHKSKRFTDHEVWDLCCGVGGDSIALAQRGRVYSVDISEAACLRTAWNAEVYGVGSNVETRTGIAETTEVRDRFVHIDPDRRAGKNRQGPRSLRLANSVPSLDFLQQLTVDARGGAIKLSPASDFLGKFPGCEIELISLNGECKEATIWFGELAGADPFRATVLPSGETLAGDPMASIAEIGGVSEYIHDPDPGLVRAGLIDLAAESLELERLDDAEEYLTSSTPVESSFVQSFRVLDVLPNNDREVRRAIQATDFGQVEIKCRHIPISAESIRRKLKLSGKQAGTIIYARVLGKTQVILCERQT